MSMSHGPPPEAVLIRRSRNALGLSPERIVQRMTHAAKISGRHWRHIEDGVKKAPDDTLAHMAYVAQVEPERLDKEGRPEAAAILAEIYRQAERDASDEPARAPTEPPEEVFLDPVEQEIWEMQTLSYAQKADLIATERAKRLTTDLRRETEKLRGENEALRRQTIRHSPNRGA